MTSPSAKRSELPGIDRLPPHSIEAEQAVLGCILLSPNDCLAECISKFKRGSDVFYDLRHQKLYEELYRLFDERVPIDLITLPQRLKDAGTLDDIGGIGYISSLPDTTPGAANLGHYIAIVHEKYLRRRLLANASDICGRVFEFEGKPAELFDVAERLFMELNLERATGRELEWKAVIAQAIDLMEEYQRGSAQLRGLSTGFAYFDKMCAGFEPGQMIVIAGRPGSGKTSMGFNLIEHAAVELKLPVGIFSLEMTAAELGVRSIFQLARADLQRYRTGYLENKDIPRLVNAAAKVSAAKIAVDDSGSLTIMELRSKARRWRAERGIRLLLIDYLQLLHGNGNYREKRDEVSDVSRGIKALAKELEIPIVVLAQMNREHAKEKKRLPDLTDLAESDAIGRDADLVGMLHEPKLTEQEEEEMAVQNDWAKHSQRMNLHIAKQRNGPTGKVELLFQKSCMRFVSYLRAKPGGGEIPSRQPTPSEPEEML